MIFAELRRMLAAILLAGAMVILAALVAGCEGHVRAEMVMRDGERIICPTGVFWFTEQDTIICRVAIKDGGFIVKGYKVAEIDYLDVRP